MRILHVETNTNAAKTTERMLEGVAGMYERTALGENAVKMASQGRYDLILMDVLLPDIDGLDVIRRLRANGVQSPVLILSWLVDEAGVFDAKALGAVDGLGKPFTQEDLLRRVQTAVARSGLSYPSQPDSASVIAGRDRVAESDQRRHRRFRTDRPARIAQGPGIDCRIVDMSHGGAGIQLLADHFDLPNSFQILFDDGTRHTCRVCSRQGRRLGVKFLGRSG